MIIELDCSRQAADLRQGDIFEVIKIEDDGHVFMQLEYRREKDPDTPPQDLSISVADGVGVAERLG